MCEVTVQKLTGKLFIAWFYRFYPQYCISLRYMDGNCIDKLQTLASVGSR